MTDRAIPIVLVVSGALGAVVCIVAAGSRRVSSRTSSALKLWGLVGGFACVLSGVAWTYGGSIKRVGLFVAGCAVAALVLSRVSALLLGAASKRSEDRGDDSTRAGREE
ncbi:MAG: hypothetical protein HY724_01325 [Candidatus Rokubacteria bacterium]|nr:hypothetical protein [Candidatus Rokubacteria bacterium]